MSLKMRPEYQSSFALNLTWILYSLNTFNIHLKYLLYICAEKSHYSIYKQQVTWGENEPNLPLLLWMVTRNFFDYIST